MWLQQQIRQEERGEEKWRAFITALNLPPADTRRAGASRPLTPAQQIRAAAEAAVGDPGAAFAAALAR